MTLPSPPPAPTGDEIRLRRACEAAPRDPRRWGVLGQWLAGQGRPVEAADAFERTLALAPNWPPALVGLGVARSALGDVAGAAANYRQALERDPRYTPALRNLRILLIGQERHTEALAVADAALAAGADPGEAQLSRGTALFALGDQAGALAAFEVALAGGADRYETLTKAAAAHSAAGRDAAALALLDDACALRPGDALALLRRALIRLSRCEFAGGWQDYETRFRNPAFLAEAGPAIVQVRERLAVAPTRAAVRGRRVLVVAEQGIGDQVMFAGMLPDLAAEAAEVTCLCDPRLVALFARSFPDVRVVAIPGAGLSSASFDTLLAMGSLGGLYRNALSDFPRTPYLRAGEAVVRTWAERLGPRPPGLRIGLSWRGGTPRTRAGERSVSLDQLAPVLALQGCEFVSLQYGDVAAEVAAANHGRAYPLRAFPASDIDDFDALAGLVANLDVVVSVQTSLVHLAGATGREVLTLIPRHAEWRYTTDREAMPWYPSVRLFRQAEARDWTPVIGRVCEVLRERIPA